jgi:hypothetical protein
MARPVSGFSMADESLEQFDEAVAQAIEVIREAMVRVDRLAVARGQSATRVQAARGDAQFSKFMRRVTKRTQVWRRRV